MGLFGKMRQDPAFGDRLRAAIAMLQGDQAAAARFQQLQIQREAAARQQAEAQREQETREGQIWGAKELGYSVPQISAMGPGDLSQVVRERFTPRQYGPTGGSTAYTNPDGTVRYEQAPWREQVGRSIVGADANGANPGVRYRGQEIIPVPNVGAFGATDLGLVDPDQPPQLGFLPQTGAAPPPQAPVADPQASADEVPVEAPAFRPRPGAIAGPPAPRRSAALGNPVEELTRIVGMRPSSGYRTQRHQDSLRTQGLTRARRSQHTAGNALDFPIPAGPQQQAAAARIRQRYPQARFEFEGTNLHVSLPGWGGAPDVSGSRRRYPEGGGGNQALLRQQARDAIRQGRDPAQVRARLRQMGVNDSGL